MNFTKTLNYIHIDDTYLNTFWKLFLNFCIKVDVEIPRGYERGRREANIR